MEKLIMLIGVSTFIFISVYILLKLEFKLNHIIYILLICLKGNYKFILFGHHNIYEWVTTGDLPILLRLIDSNFLVNDFYTNSISESPKIIFGYLIFIISNIINYEYSIFFLKNIIFLSSPILIYLILINFINLNSNKLFNCLILTGIILFGLDYLSFIFTYVRVGIGSFTSFNDVSAQSFSHILGLLSILLFINNKKFFWQLSLFSTTIIHPLVGIAYFFLLTVYFKNQNYNFNLYQFILEKLMKHKFNFLICIVIPYMIILITFYDNYLISSEEFVYIYSYLRHPHHYILSSFFNKLSFLYMCFPLGSLLIGVIKKNNNLINTSLITFCFFIFCLLTQYLGTEIYKSKFISSIGPTRFLSISFFCYAILAINCFNLLINRK